MLGWKDTCYSLTDSINVNETVNEILADMVAAR